MAVRQRRGAWQADVQDKGTRYRRTFATREEAELWFADSRLRLIRGLTPELVGQTNGPAIITISQAVLSCRQRWWAGKRGERTAVTNAQHAIDHFGPDTPINSINEGGIDSWVAKLKGQGLSPATINRKLAALSKVLQHAYRAQWINRLPTIPKEREAGKRERWLTPAEEEVIVSWFR